MVRQDAHVRRAPAAPHSAPGEQNNLAEAVDHVLHEVRAARRDLRMTGFCLHQAEAFRRIDRAKVGLADLAQFRHVKLS